MNTDGVFFHSIPTMAHSYVCGTCVIYEWVMSHIWMSHVTHMNESCHILKYAVPFISMRHVTHTNAHNSFSQNTHEGPFVCQWHFLCDLTLSCATCRIYMGDVAHAYVSQRRLLKVCLKYTLQHTATHCITLQRTATHCNAMQHDATHVTEAPL